MKSAFDMLPKTAQQSVKFGWILEGLVGAFHGPDPIPVCQRT
ncbi:MAG: hypothetical protein ABI947_16840 [Chloroflexota bacterium]